MPPATKAEILERAAIALSLANFCFLTIWREILHVASEQRFLYLLGTRPDPLLFWALLLDVAVLAAVLFGLLSLCSSNSRPPKLAATIILGLICLFATYQCQSYFNGIFYGVISFRSILVLRIILAAAIVFLIIRWPKRVLPGARSFALLLSPLFFIFMAQGLWLYYGANSPRLTPKHVAGMLPAKASHGRVIWIIFDELDYRLVFEARPTRIQLPQFDALRRTSIFADHVKAPAHDTLSAIPSLLLSTIIPDNQNVDTFTSPVRVRFSGCSRFVALRSQQNVFQRVRNLGFNTAVSGWYHPYCRLFGNDLSECSTAVGTGMALVIPQQLLRKRPFLEKAVYLARWEARSLPLTGRFHWIAPMPDESRDARELHIIKNKAVMEAGARMLRNRKLNFVFLHLPVPHAPGIWNTRTQSFSTNPQLDYIDNLELADRRLGQIRKLLEQTGDWDRSTILVSADHPYRPNLWLENRASAALPDLLQGPESEMVRLTDLKWQPYIPFLLKLPGQKTGIEYHREFNSVLSANLLLAALQGQIRTPAHAVQWLDAHAAASEEKVCR